MAGYFPRIPNVKRLLEGQCLSMEFGRVIQSVLARPEVQKMATPTSEYSTRDNWRGGRSSEDLFTEQP